MPTSKKTQLAAIRVDRCGGQRDRYSAVAEGKRYKAQSAAATGGL
jgi:hypothetical protein